MAKLRGRRSVSYGRVSTNSEQQKTSIEAQKAYYADKFTDKGYEVAPVGAICKANGSTILMTNGIYADEGISGTSMKNRKAFNLMIEDAKQGKFDIIFVKSFSRYARSTIDGLKTCEELREIGVGVYFEDYNICSINEDKDFELALFFSLAQKESQTKSYNVKWGLRQRQKSGNWRGTPPYGYTKDEDGEFQIIPEQAEAVKLIVEWYLDGLGASSIVSNLREQGITAQRGGGWCATHIRNILKQELYSGKYYTHTMENPTIKDHSKKEYIPREEQVLIPLPHCQIIDDETWARVQAERERRNKLHIENGGYRNRNTYLLSNLLYCECGCAYRVKVDNRPAKRGGVSVNYWRCSDVDKYGSSSTCLNKTGFHFKEEIIEELIKQEILRLRESTESLLDLFYIKELVTTGFPMDATQIKELQAKKVELEGSIKKIILRSTLSDVGGGIYEDILNEMEGELRGIRNTLDMQDRRENIIKSDKLAFDRYVKDLEEVDLDHLTNSSLKRLFYKIYLVDMSHFSKECEQGQRGISFDYYFLKMPYTELIDKAVKMGYPNPESLSIEIKPF